MKGNEKNYSKQEVESEAHSAMKRIEDYLEWLKSQPKDAPKNMNDYQHYLDLSVTKIGKKPESDES